jgi:hypothetical protein
MAGNTSSNEASAIAFEAISNVFAGLAILEREGIDASPEVFNNAVNLMYDAIQRFRELADNNSVATSSLETLGVTDAQLQALQGIDRSATVGDLFRITADSLKQSYVALKNFLEDKILEKYSLMRQQISITLGIGETASGVMANIKPQ